MFEFAAPFWLLLLPLPVVVWWAAERRRGRQAEALRHPQAALLGELARATKTRRSIPWLWLLGCALLVAAMARPQWLDFTDPRAEPGHNVLFAVDVSGSMRTLDYVADDNRLSRLAMLKRALDRFMEQARHVRVGVVVFADEAVTLIPLTTDLDLARQLAAEITAGMAGERTALGDAIALSVARLRAVEAPGRALVLLTDGANTSGTLSPDAAARLAGLAGIRIFAVGLGSAQPAPFPRGPLEGPARVVMPLDEARLRTIAEHSGGRYYRVRRPGDMDQVFADIQRLATTGITDPRFAAVREWYWLPALTALALLLLAEGRRGDSGTRTS